MTPLIELNAENINVNEFHYKFNNFSGDRLIMFSASLLISLQTI